MSLTGEAAHVSLRHGCQVLLTARRCQARRLLVEGRADVQTKASRRLPKLLFLRSRASRTLVSCEPVGGRVELLLQLIDLLRAALIFSPVLCNQGVQFLVFLFSVGELLVTELSRRDRGHVVTLHTAVSFLPVAVLLVLSGRHVQCFGTDYRGLSLFESRAGTGD